MFTTMSCSEHNPSITDTGLQSPIQSCRSLHWERRESVCKHRQLCMGYLSFYRNAKVKETCWT